MPLALRAKVTNHLARNFIQMYPRLWLMDIVQVFRKVPEYVQWLPWQSQTFMSKGNEGTINIHALLHCITICIGVCFSGPRKRYYQN